MFAPCRALAGAAAAALAPTVPHHAPHVGRPRSFRLLALGQFIHYLTFCELVARSPGTTLDPLPARAGISRRSGADRGERRRLSCY